ncbi:MAG: glycerate kinase [Kineosporiaceae bacterium]
MPHLVVALDKFKGSLTSREAGEALALGLRATSPHPVRVIEVADGGDGLLAALATAGLPREPLEPLDTREPGGELIWFEDAAILESAQYVGLVRGGVRVVDPLGASSEPVGRAIRALLPRRPARVIVGVGGTNCTDGGLGLLRGLGAEAFDAAGRPLPPGGGALSDLDHLDLTGLPAELLGEAPVTRLVFATDVDVPLTGPLGAARMFAPQKGATPDQVELLERGLCRLADVLGLDPAIPGSGAGGGMPAAALAVLGASITSGADLVLRATGLGEALTDALVVFTGEGAIDEQTAHGKGPGRVVQWAAAAGVPVVLVAGSVAPAGVAALGPAVAAWYAVSERARDRADSMARAAELLEDLGRRIGGSW